MSQRQPSARLIQLPLPAPRVPDAPPTEPAAPMLPARRLPAIREWPDSEKPRERLVRHGAQSLSDAELIAILLRTGEGAGKGSAVDQARALLVKFGGPSGLAAASATELCREPGVGPAKACSIVAAFALAERARSTGGGVGEAIGSSKQVFDLMAPRLARKRAEEFWVLLLNTRNHLIREVQIAVGSLSGAQVHPREVFSAAVREGAAALIFVHTPGRRSSPSARGRRRCGRGLEVPAGARSRGAGR